jgi:hypothetical protein
MSTTKQYEVWFTENNQDYSFTKDIANIDIARTVAESFKNTKERSNVRILEISIFNNTIRFNL